MNKQEFEKKLGAALEKQNVKLEQQQKADEETNARIQVERDAQEQRAEDAYQNKLKLIYNCLGSVAKVFREKSHFYESKMYPNQFPRLTLKDYESRSETMNAGVSSTEDFVLPEPIADVGLVIQYKHNGQKHEMEFKFWEDSLSVTSSSEHQTEAQRKDLKIDAYSAEPTRVPYSNITEDEVNKWLSKFLEGVPNLDPIK